MNFCAAADNLFSRPPEFTAKERDSESGLDYFGARYYGSALGRWTSPDWAPADLVSAMPVPFARLRDPQTLNLYSYARGNPLAAPDIDGHFLPAPQVPEAEPREELEREEAEFRELLQNAARREREDRERELRESIRRMTDQQRDFMMRRYIPRSGGRWGGYSTRAQNAEITLTALKNGYQVVGGGGLAKEEFIPASGPVSGGLGGTYVDITLQKGDSIIRVQTINTTADGEPTPGEAAAAARIKASFPKDVLVLVPKNSAGTILDSTFK